MYIGDVTTLQPIFKKTVCKNSKGDASLKSGEHEDINVLTAGNHVVETTVTDVVRGRYHETTECLVEGTHRHHR